MRVPAPQRRDVRRSANTGGFVSIAEQTYEFVASFEPWQQDLFLRAAATPTLGEADQDAALKLLLDPAAGPPRLVGRGDLAQRGTHAEPLELLAIENPTDVNALAGGAVLQFAGRGLNIVYGDNGAGKTGYSRIIKHVGRALEREQVLPDVLADTAPSGPPRARLRISRGGITEEHDVRLDEAGPPGLAAISCYDSSCGDRYLTSANEIDYIPYAVDALRRLAEAQTVLGRGCANKPRRPIRRRSTWRRIRPALRSGRCSRASGRTPPRRRSSRQRT